MNEFIRMVFVVATALFMAWLTKASAAETVIFALLVGLSADLNKFKNMFSFNGEQ